MSAAVMLILATDLPEETPTTIHLVFGLPKTTQETH